MIDILLEKRKLGEFKNLDNGQQNGHGVIGIMINTVAIIVMIMCVINI